MAYYSPASDYSLGALIEGGDAGGGVGREQIAQAMLAQQGMPPPQGGGQLIDFGERNPQPGGNYPQGFDIARGPDQGAPYNSRQQLGGGWATEGNNVYDPSGSLVGSQGLQQYGYIPGVSPPPNNSLANSQFAYQGHSPAAADTLGATGANVFGRTGDDTSPGSRAAQDTQAEALAASALGRESMSDRSVTAPSFGTGPIGYSPDFNQATPNADIAITGGRSANAPAGFPTSGPFDPMSPGWTGPPAGNVLPGWNPTSWDPQTGQPLTQQAIQTGPNPNAPGNAAQAGSTGQPGGFGASQGWSGDFGGYSPGAGGFGGFGDFGGYSGSGFNSEGSYSGGYDTAAGNVGY